MIEAMKLALDALEAQGLHVPGSGQLAVKAKYKLHQAIAELESQEPMAWVNQSAIDWLNGNALQGSNEYVQTNLAKRKNNSATVPIFTHPPQRTEQKPLTIDGNTSDGHHTFNELYQFRTVYNAALFNEWAAVGKCSVHKSWRHHDGELCFGGGWFIVVAVLPAGLISNHYKAKDWDLFAIPEEKSVLFEYDGHTGADVVERLKAYTPPAQPALQKAAATLQAACHGAAKQAGWWADVKTGQSITANPYCFSNKLMLVVSELAEAMEGDRKSLKDDKLPHRTMREVEMADAVIRIFDLAGAYNMDLGGAISEKMEFNAERADHKIANRSADGGKAY